LAMACLVSLSLFSGWPNLPFLPKTQKAYATFPTVAATTSSNAGAFVTSHVVDLPSGVSSGDLLIVFFAGYNNSAGYTSTWPDGWSQLYNVSYGTGVNVSNVAAYYRHADGTEGSTITVTGSNGESTHISYRITGWDSSTPPEAASPVGGTNANPNPPSLTPSWGTADTLWIATANSGFVNHTVSGYPSNYTNGMSQRSTAGSAIVQGSARRELNASSEDPGTFTFSGTSNWKAATVAVKSQQTFTQRAFRFYEDGSESGSSAVDSQDTNINRQTDSDSNLALRLSVQETANSGGASTDDWQLQYSKNGGAYTDVTGSSSNVKGYNSGSLTDAGATTNRATNGISDPGTGSFVAGLISEDGLLDNHQLTAANYTEHLFSLTIIAADTAAGDTLDFRILYKGAATNMTYSVTPRITITKSGPTTDDVMRHGNWFSGGAEQDFYWAD
jgi:hypothetical protein